MLARVDESRLVGNTCSFAVTLIPPTFVELLKATFVYTNVSQYDYITRRIFSVKPRAYDYQLHLVRSVRKISIEIITVLCRKEYTSVCERKVA